MFLTNPLLPFIMYCLFPRTTQPTLFPYTTLFRSSPLGLPRIRDLVKPSSRVTIAFDDHTTGSFGPIRPVAIRAVLEDRKSTRLNSSHPTISYAVFCLKKKNYVLPFSFYESTQS